RRDEAARDGGAHDDARHRRRRQRARGVRGAAQRGPRALRARREGGGNQARVVDLRVLLLCGGASVRFGRNKLIEKIGERSEPMALVSARAYFGAGRVLAVTRTGERELRALLEAAGCEVMESDRSIEGLGASLAAGVEA